MAKAIFLDKDGTLIPDIPYNTNPDLITLQPQLIDGLKHLQSKGYLFIIVSNQAGIAKGYFSENELSAVELKMYSLFNMHGLTLTGFYYCPHHPEGTVKPYAVYCECRKPRPGMLLQAARKHDIDLSRSWMIGDILNDVEAGNLAGCKTVLIDNGNETEWIQGLNRIPAHTCKNINEAAGIILLKQLHHELAGL